MCTPQGILGLPTVWPQEVPSPVSLPKQNPARRNRSATKATLSRIHNVVAPVLPEREDWHQLTLDWWEQIWASPMAPEFDTSDIHGLLVLADLVNAYWLEASSGRRAVLAKEIRLQRQCFGLTPIDRRRLQWEIERTDAAQDRGARRRATRVVPAGDPRAVLDAAQ